MDTAFAYFKIDVNNVRGTKDGVGYLCCSVNRPSNDIEPFYYQVSFSFCNPNDQFSRQIAHEIIKSRFERGDLISVKLKEKMPIKKVIDIAVKKMLNEKSNVFNIPNWVLSNVIYGKNGFPKNIRRRPRHSIP